MTQIPTYTADLDGILAIGGVVPAGSWMHLLAPDGSGQIIWCDPNGTTKYVDASLDDPYTQFSVSKDGGVGSVMPERSGGPLDGARWIHFALIVVPTTGL